MILGGRPPYGVIVKRRTRRVPSAETLARVRWLEALVEEFGTDEVARWQDGPPREWEFKAWRERRIRTRL